MSAVIGHDHGHAHGHDYHSGGILRWVTSEQAAIALYGANWNKNIDDIADTFYVNYTFGPSVAGLADFDPVKMQASAQFPSDNL
jgi:hypothetical protein